MFRARFVVAVLIPLTLTAVCTGQSEPTTATCNLDDGRQVYIRYNPVSAKNDRAPNGKPWAPGGAPMTLFTEAQLNFAGATIPKPARGRPRSRLCPRRPQMHPPHLLRQDRHLRRFRC